MHTVWQTLAQLAPALAQVPALPADTMPIVAPQVIEQPATSVFRPLVDWSAERGAVVPMFGDTARTRTRAKAVEMSGFYKTRLSIHRTLSYTMIPLFIGSYVTGDQLLKHPNDPPKWATDLHKPFAIATGSVFAVNTITGLWNLYDSRHNEAGRTKRTIHTLLFLAASAGFTYAGTSLAHEAKTGDPTHYHRTVALASMGVSVIGWGMMALFK